jgi:Ca2+-binding RTX toxin-like protein
MTQGNGLDRSHGGSIRPDSRRTVVVLAGIMLPAVAIAAVINGTPGPDVLEGTPEADTIDGKGGADTMMGLPGNDTYIVGQADDEVLEGAGDGIDTVRSSVSFTLPIFVENLTLAGSAPTNGTGNGLNNRLTGNPANNRLNGRTGADRMFGRGGNDTYYVDASGDVTYETVTGGVDTVRSTVTHTLRIHVEKLILIGNGVVSGTGNGLANTITGNVSNNTLNGLAGDDILNGGGGDDVLSGGPGNDRLSGGLGQDNFQFDEPADAQTNVDRITGFSPPTDMMRLVGEAFPALTADGTLQAAAFRIGIVAGDENDRILYDPGSGNVRYDADGSGPAASVRFATLVAGPAITNANFTVVDPVATGVDYATEIQPIFNSRCISCHSGVSAPQGLRLDANNSYANLVGVASNEVPSLQRVEPGDPDNSYLVQKVEGTADVGGQMPLGGPPLSAATIAVIRQWISEGANP